MMEFWLQVMPLHHLWQHQAHPIRELLLVLDYKHYQMALYLIYSEAL